LLCRLQFPLCPCHRCFEFTVCMDTLPLALSWRRGPSTRCWWLSWSLSFRHEDECIKI
jgi:hypothetical protein